MVPCEKWMLAEHGWNVRPPTHGKERPVHLVEPWGIVKGISLLSGYNRTVKATKPASLWSWYFSARCTVFTVLPIP